MVRACGSSVTFIIFYQSSLGELRNYFPEKGFVKMTFSGDLSERALVKYGKKSILLPGYVMIIYHIETNIVLDIQG